MKREEYPDFFKRLKYIVANSHAAHIALEKAVKKKKCPNFVKQLENLIARSSVGSIVTNAIVDLSHWNENIDFKLAKKDGIIGVIHKATQGTKYVDPKYAERRKAAENEGLLWGAYHFGVEEDGKDQADHFLNTVGDNLEVLLALDIEENGHGENITPKQAEDFIKRIQEVTGRLPLIYGNANFLKDFATPILTKCPLWIARWGAKPILPKGWEKWVLWQYTDGKAGPEPHSAKGIGPCGRSKFNGTLGELKKFWLSKGVCC